LEGINTLPFLSIVLRYSPKNILPGPTFYIQFLGKLC
jgi:hypothetical protein